MAFFRLVKIPAISLIKLVIALPSILVAGWILNQHYFFTKTLSNAYHPGHQVRVVGPITPTSIIRTADPTLPWQVTTDALPFNVLIPRLIESIRLQVRLNPGTAQYVTINAQAKVGGDYSTIALASFLDTLTWSRVGDRHMTLWMRDKRVMEQEKKDQSSLNFNRATTTKETPVGQYSSVNAFLNNPPDLQRVATVGFDRMALVSIPNYRPGTRPISINHTFRGQHRLYVYAADEELKLMFDKIDLNRKKGADIMTVLVARADQFMDDSRVVLKTISMADDGNTGASSKPGKAQPVAISIPVSAPGVYVIDIIATEDVVFKNIVSTQKHLAFAGGIFLAEGPSYGQPSFTSATIESNGSLVRLAAVHDEGKQKIMVDDTSLELKRLKVDAIASELDGVTTFDIIKGDVTVTSDGLLSIVPAELLPVGTASLDLAGTPDLTSYDYVLAAYTPRTRGLVKFDKIYALADLDLQGTTLTFSVEEPGLTASGTALGLKDIRATLTRGPFPWHKILVKLNHLLGRSS